MGKRGTCGQLFRVVHMPLLIHRDAGVAVNAKFQSVVKTTASREFEPLITDFDEIKLLFV